MASHFLARHVAMMISGGLMVCPAEIVGVEEPRAYRHFHTVRQYR